jgi:glycine C-acetyltransferase
MMKEAPVAKKKALDVYLQQLEDIRKAGTWREERVITTPQMSRIDTTQNQDVLNLCANNYLGLSNDSRVIKAARDAYDTWGFGLSSVRFICGTQLIHKRLEQRLAAFLQMDDVILYSSCFDANGGLFETLLGENDAVISDELNHASIIDGIRLCKARRLRYKNSDMAQLEQHLRDTQDCRIRLIATDGVFSMDGYLARLKDICDLAERYDALVMVDDSHATGFMGQAGRGTHEACGVMGRVDIITSTFGKALGGASGGFTAARQPIVDLLRQRSRPYLFSNSLAPTICAATLKALDLLESSTELRDRVHENAGYFRSKMGELGFELLPGEHPIVPVMLYDAHVAQEMATRMLAHGVYVIAFSYPVVPQGKARIRTQISAAHSHEDLDRAVGAFKAVKQEMKL